MTKKIIALLLCALMIIVVSGCETAETTVTNTEVNYEELYQKTLVKTYDFIKNVDFDAEYDDCYMGIFEALLTLGDEGINAIEYVIKDINKDNVPELLIGSFDKHENAYTNNDIYAIYSIINNKAEFVVGGRSRSMYSLNEDGNLFYIGSNGAAYSIFGVYHISKDGKVVCDDYYFTYPDDNDYSKIELYHNQTGEFQRESSEKLDIAYDDFWKLHEEFAKETVKITANSFDKFSH